MDTFDDEPKPDPLPEYWGATINDPDGKAAYLITAGGGHDWELKLNGAEVLLKLTHLDGRAGVLAAKAECLEVVTRINGILVNRFRTDGNLSLARMVSWVHGDPGYVDIPLSLVITQTSLTGLRYTPFWNTANEPTPHRLAVFVHEYLHFVHNFSTVAGLYDFVAQLRLLRPFCNTVSVDGRSVGGNVLDSETHNEIASILKWRAHLRGGGAPQTKSALGRLNVHPQFLCFRYEKHDIKLAAQSISCVSVVVTFDSSALPATDIPIEITLGSEVLMEGCAVEAECMLLERMGGSAYQVRAGVPAYPYQTARTIFEGVTGVSPSSKLLCCLCVLALQSTDPGEAFIQLVSACKPGKDEIHLNEDDLLEQFLEKSKAFLTQRIEAILTQMMPLEIAPFELRGHAGRGLKRMLDWCNALFELRVADSFFEFDALDKLPDLDLLVALLRSMPVCPIIQEVDTSNNNEEVIFFSERELPSSVIDEIGAAQSLLHFASTHLRQDGAILETSAVQNRPCFFSKACHAPLAKEKSLICRQTPWEAFAPPSGNGCWYALGVAAARALIK